MGHAKHWCYTLHEEAITLRMHDAYKNDEVVYHVRQIEICPTTKREHWQGFMSFRKKIKLTTLKRNYSATAHWEVAKGSPGQNKAYCTKLESRKEGTEPIEDGSPPKGQGIGV